MRKRNAIKASGQDILIDAFCLVSCIFIFIITVYPFYYVLINSLNESTDAMRGGIFLWPRVFSIDNYKAFLLDEKWLVGIRVTAARTLLGTTLTVLVTSLVAFGLSFKELAFRRVYMLAVIVCMYFSGGLIPYYVVLRTLGLINTFFVYIIPSMLNLFFLMIAISFFQAIPAELRESAVIDGAGEFRTLLSIILPVSKPLLATMALFVGVGQWNAWFDSAFFVRDRGLRTLGFALMEVINKSLMTSSAASMAAIGGNSPVTTKSIQMTAMVIAVFPILCVYPFLQKYFVKGIMLGAVKG